MSLKHFDGFDYGVPMTPDWTAVALTNGFTAGSGRRTGTGALDLASTDDYVEKAIAATTEAIICLALKGYGADGPFLTLYEGATVHLTFEFGAAPNRYLIVKLGDGTTLHTDDDANDNSSWDVFEIRAKISDTVGEIEVQKGGTTIISLTAQDTNNAGALGRIDKYRISGTHLAAAATSTWVDDHYAVDAADATGQVTFIGATVRVDMVQPAADSTSEWSTSDGGTTHYTLVDDDTSDGDSSYVHSASLDARDLYTPESLPYVPSNIFGVKACAVVKEDAAASFEVAPALKYGATHYTGTAVALSTSWQMAAHLWTSHPATVAGWTRTGLGQTKFGVRLTAI